ncbi:hypothetical protein BDQ17DRAFT_1309102 [Cyathus striatus]|nr:hypothetical protein BDQ17DRAFT_1309102 [Cyathus striatus]
MSMSMSSSQLPSQQPTNSESFLSMTVESLAGIPPEKDPSRSLWEHICRKESLPPPPLPKPNPIFIPTGPMDKHATSMRVLLHDTQLNFENFAKHTEKLLKEVGESKNEIKVLKALFEREHETLTGEIMDLVNRCQTQIQKSLGTPAQASHLSQIQKEIELRLSNFDERLESIKMVHPLSPLIPY